MVATLDGESEPITIEELRDAAKVLARVHGSAVVGVGDGTPRRPRWRARPCASSPMPACQPTIGQPAGLDRALRAKVSKRSPARDRSQETLRKLRERRGNRIPDRRPCRAPTSGDRHVRFDHPTPATGADLRALPDPSDPRATAEAILFEIRRVIVGQDAMLERILVGLLSGGHLLLEGVPGLAKTLTIKTLADVLGGSFKRIQFTPDLMPSDLVGTRIYRPDKGSASTSSRAPSSRTSCSPTRSTAPRPRSSPRCSR